MDPSDNSSNNNNNPPTPDYGANPTPTFPPETPIPTVPNDPQPPAPPSWMNQSPSPASPPPQDPSQMLNNQTPPAAPPTDPLSNPASSFPPISLENTAPPPPAANPPLTPETPAIQDQIIPPTQAPTSASTDPSAPVGIPTPTFSNPPDNTGTPPPSTMPTDPTNSPPPQGLPPLSPTPATQDSAPTDLSHLIGENTQAPPSEIYNPPVAAPENLVVPSAQPAVASGAESVNSSRHHMNLSKILIAVGVLVVLLVSGASAYFILGAGKSAPAPQSQPAQPDQSQLTNPPKQITKPSPIPTPAEEVASGSANFGSINSLDSAPSPSPKSSPSALDLLKNRKSSTSSSTTR